MCKYVSDFLEVRVCGVCIRTSITSFRRLIHTIPQFDVETESLEVTHVESEYKKALVRTTVTVSSAVAFGIGIWAWRGRKSAFEFFAGYLVEQSLRCGVACCSHRT
jgi:hypothetical protein